MKICPECKSSNIQPLNDNYFCLDCEWDNLPTIKGCATLTKQPNINNDMIEYWRQNLAADEQERHNRLFGVYENEQVQHHHAGELVQDNSGNFIGVDVGNGSSYSVTGIVDNEGNMEFTQANAHSPPEHINENRQPIETPEVVYFGTRRGFEIALDELEGENGNLVCGMEENIRLGDKACANY